MSVTINIHCDSAKEALAELRDLAALTNPVMSEIRKSPEQIANENFLGGDQWTPEQIAAAVDKAEARMEAETEQALAVELDAAGVPFDPEIHTGTKLKDGTWRTRKGAVASAAAQDTPEPSPSAENAGTDNASAAEASSDVTTVSGEEDDEFAAFREAASEPATTAEVPARSWTDADLSKLLSQAVTKMGGGEAANKARSIIAEYCEGDVTPHSRHISEAKREEFAQRIEEWAEIEFAG